MTSLKELIKNNKKVVIPWFLFMVSLVFIYVQENKINYLTENPNEVAAEDARETLQAVGKLIVLPTDETPTIAKVTDLEALKSMTFFKEATIGDKILIYEKAGKAILYNPKINKIIEIAPFDLNKDNTVATGSNR